MALNVGSLLVKAKFETGNMMSGLGAMNSRFKESQLAAKQATTQFGRMKGSLMAMGTTAALTSGALLAMLMNAIMKSPFLAAALAKLKTQMMLFGNAIARHLAPILEKVVDFVKWLREKFQALPEPIQAVIVKFAAIGIIILGLIISIGFLGVALGGIKLGLLALGIPAAIVKLGALGTAILGSTIATGLLTIGLGLITGGLAVLALDELGIIDWFVNLGSKVADIDNVLRDVLLTIALFTRATEGIGVIDIIRGDSNFTMMKESKRSAEAARERLKHGTSWSVEGGRGSNWESRKGYYTGYGQNESLDFGGSLGETEKSKTEIAAQNNYFDFSGLTNGTPEELIESAKLFEGILVENQERLNP
jgi:hypothetical protein